MSRSTFKAGTRRCNVMGVARQTLYRAITDVKRNLEESVKSTEKARDLMERIYSYTKDRDYLMVIDRMNKILRELREIIDDLEYELTIL